MGDSEAIMYTEIINDIDDMADAVELAQEAGLVVSAGETLDALKARLMAHYVNPDHDHTASCLQAQGMQIDTDNDLVEVLAIIAELDDINDAFELAKDEGIDNDGYRVTMNCNEAAGQTVFHLHLHLLGGRRMNWPPG